MSFFNVENSLPTAVVLALVLLAAFWGFIVACYIADLAWIFCFAHQAAEAKKRAFKEHMEMLKRAATSRCPVFVVDQIPHYEEASRQLIRAM